MKKYELEVYSVAEKKPEYGIDVFFYREEHDDWFVGSLREHNGEDHYVECWEGLSIADVSHWSHNPKVKQCKHS